MAADPALINSAELASRMGVSTTKLHRWRRERSPDGQRLRACIYRATSRSTDWHVERLRKAGFIPALVAAPAIAAVQTVEGAAFIAAAPWGYVQAARP